MSDKSGRNPLVSYDATPDLDADEAESDDDSALEISDELWDALEPDDDYESVPEPGDFWTDEDAA